MRFVWMQIKFSWSQSTDVLFMFVTTNFQIKFCMIILFDSISSASHIFACMSIIFFFFKFWKMEKILINMETAYQSQGFKLIRFIFFYFLNRVSFLYFDRRLKRQSKPSMYHFGFQELIRFLYMALNLLSW